MIMRKTRSKRDKVQRPVLFFLVIFARLLLTIFETFFLPLEEKSTHIGIAQLIQINSVFFFPFSLFASLATFSFIHACRKSSRGVVYNNDGHNRDCSLGFYDL